MYIIHISIVYTLYLHYMCTICIIYELYGNASHCRPAAASWIAAGHAHPRLLHYYPSHQHITSHLGSTTPGVLQNTDCTVLATEALLLLLPLSASLHPSTYTDSTAQHSTMAMPLNVNSSCCGAAMLQPLSKRRTASMLCVMQPAGCCMAVPQSCKGF